MLTDHCEDSYVEMHPATMSTNLPPTEEEEEEEDQPEEVYIEMDPTEYIPPPTLFYDKAELKAEVRKRGRKGGGGGRVREGEGGGRVEWRAGG